MKKETKHKRCPRCGKDMGIVYGKHACFECLRMDMIYILTLEGKKKLNHQND